MAVATQGSVPRIVTAGDTVIFSLGPNTLYPNTGWTVKFVISRDGRKLASWDGATDPSSSGFIFTLDSATLAKVAPGPAEYFLVYTEILSSQRETSDFGCINILPDPTQSLPDSETAKAFKAANEAITRLMTDSGEYASVNFNGQSYTSRNIKELIDARDMLRIQLDAELRSLGVSRRGGAKTILFRFT